MKRKKTNIIHNNFYFLKKAFIREPMYLVASIFMRVISSFRTTFMYVYFLGYIISAVEEGKALTQILEFIVISFVIVGATYFVQSVFDTVYQPICLEKLSASLQNTLFHQAEKADISQYENEEYYTAVILANKEGSSRVLAVVNNVQDLLENILTALMLLFSSIMLDWFVPVIAAVSFTLSFLIQRHLAHERVEYDTELQIREKEASMLQRILYLPEYAKEVRITNVRDVMMKRYEKNSNDKYTLIRKKGSKISRIAAWEMILSSSVCIDFVTPLYLAFRTIIMRTMKISQFVVLLNACNQIQFKLEAITSGISVFYQNGELIERFRKVENMSSKIETNHHGNGSMEVFQTLDVKNLAFQYSQNKFGIKNVSFSIHAGEKIAFVGRNGSGKTTLMKLLLRLYDSDAGEILYNGTSIKEFNVNDYRQAYSTMFQDFNIYAASIGENVAMREKMDDKKVRQALKDAEIAEVISDIEAILTKEFSENGLLFSGGQLQRLAMARVLYEDHDILLMDEPTAAMDVRFERRFYQLLFQKLKDKTIIFVSHRLSSVMNCDQIFYMENGEIVENGTHAALMERNGKYTKLFQAQVDDEPE